MNDNDIALLKVQCVSDIMIKVAMTEKQSFQVKCHVVHFVNYVLTCLLDETRMSLSFEMLKLYIVL